MPYIWEQDSKKVAVTVDELVPAHFNTDATLRQNIHRCESKPYGIKRLQRACYGRPMLIDYDTLPREIQAALGDPRQCKHIMQQWFKIDTEAVRIYPNYTFDNGATLGVAHQEEYIVNASVLKAVKHFRELHEQERKKKGSKATKIYEFMTRECILFQETLTTILGSRPHTLPTSDKRFKETYDNFFTADGCDYSSLISGKLRNDNARKMTDKIAAILDSLFAKAGTKPNKHTVACKWQAFMAGTIDVINNETGEMYMPSDFKSLSDRTITNWLSTWESKVGTWSLRSADRQRLMGQVRVSAEMAKPKYAGSIISVDDRQPPFEYGPSQRLWLYNCLDVASDAITVTVWGKTKEGMILDFYRELVRKYTEWGVRLPAELEAESSLNSSYKDTFLREGVMFEHVKLEANNARGKIIERRNRDFRLMYEKELNGWKGRPFARDESNQALPSDTIYSDNKYIPYDKLVQQSLATIELWNNGLHPNQAEYPGMTRWDYFTSMQNDKLHPTNWKALLPHIGYRVNSSCNVGKIRLQGQNMMIGDAGQVLFGEGLINRLKRIEGQDVTIYWLDDSQGGILKALVYQGDTYVCEAIPTPKFNRAKVERTEMDELNLQIQAKYIATVDGFIKHQKNSIEAVTVIDNRPKMVNNNFSFSGMARRYDERTTDAEVLPDIDDEDNDMVLVPVHNPKNVRMADRW